MSKITLKAVVMVINIHIFFGLQFSAADDRLEYLKGLYGFTNWAGNTETNYSFYVTNWVPLFSSFGVTNLDSNNEGAWANGLKDSSYLFRPTNAPDAMVDLRVYERESVVSAHNAMMGQFIYCAAVQPFTLGVTNTAKVGDRCYIGYPINACRHIWFVRNNVFISISSDQPDFSVKSIAEDLDSQLKVISAGN